MARAIHWLTWKDTVKRIQRLYLSLEMPWIIAWSAGKDSTLAKHLFWRALMGLDAEQRRWPVYILIGDTRVEDPIVHARQLISIGRIEAACKQQNLPITVHLLAPELENRFWYCLLGLGYAAPTVRMRWCVDRTKLAPNMKFIREVIDSHGEVAILVGTREQESTNRARTMRKHALLRGKGLGDADLAGLYSHAQLKKALVFSPIFDWSVEDVWTCLLASQCPWGDSYVELWEQYKDASPGECQFALSRQVQTCAGGRTGCWTCTLSERDRTMETRIAKGASWLAPLNALRNRLKATTEPGSKTHYREMEGINGDVKLTRAGNPSPRRYKLAFRKELLRELLKAQQEVRRLGPDPTLELVSQEELEAIQRLWMEQGDLEKSVVRIWKEVMGGSPSWWQDSELAIPPWDSWADQLLVQISQEDGVSEQALRQMVSVARLYPPWDWRHVEAMERLHARDWRPFDTKVTQARAAFLAAQSLPQQGALWSDGVISPTKHKKRKP